MILELLIIDSLTMAPSEGSKVIRHSIQREILKLVRTSNIFIHFQVRSVGNKHRVKHEHVRINKPRLILC